MKLTSRQIPSTCGITGLLTVCLLGIALTVSAAPTDRYAALCDRLEPLAHGDCSRLMQFGVSGEGRPMYALVLTTPDGDSSSIIKERTRVLVLCGQHGDEPTAVHAMLDLASELSCARRRLSRAVLARTVLFIIPVVNPDGYASFRRTNGAGADLNRDWELAAQPETQAVARFVNLIGPHVIIDQHEWTDTSVGQTNSVEAPAFGHSSHHRLCRLLVRSATKQMPAHVNDLSMVMYGKDSNTRLAHRYFNNLGICSMLVETTPMWSPQSRRNTYKGFVYSVLTTIAFPPNETVLAALHDTTSGRRQADPAIASLFPSEAVTNRLPSQMYCWLALFAAVGYVVARYTGERSGTSCLNKAERVPRIVRPALTDTVRLDASTRTRLALLKLHRTRPSDRGKERQTQCAGLMRRALVK